MYTRLMRNVCEKEKSLKNARRHRNCRCRENAKQKNEGRHLPLLIWNLCAFLLAAAESVAVAVSASAAAEEKQDNPKAAVISTAIAGIKTAAVATAAAQQ